MRGGSGRNPITAGHGAGKATMRNFADKAARDSRATADGYLDARLGILANLE
jgi:hypothetical protein